MRRLSTFIKNCNHLPDKERETERATHSVVIASIKMLAFDASMPPKPMMSTLMKRRRAVKRYERAIACRFYLIYIFVRSHIELPSLPYAFEELATLFVTSTMSAGRRRMPENMSRRRATIRVDFYEPSEEASLYAINYSCFA